MPFFAAMKRSSVKGTVRLQEPFLKQGRLQLVRAPSRHADFREVQRAYCDTEPNHINRLVADVALMLLPLLAPEMTQVLVGFQRRVCPLCLALFEPYKNGHWLLWLRCRCYAPPHEPTLQGHHDNRSREVCKTCHDRILHGGVAGVAGGTFHFNVQISFAIQCSWCADRQ